jgi:hypothetical protein
VDYVKIKLIGFGAFWGLAPVGSVANLGKFFEQRGFIKTIREAWDAAGCAMI